MSDNAQHHSPLSQFEVVPLKQLELAGYDISFTNSSLFMVLAVAGVVFFLAGGIRGRALIPTRWQSMVELSYLFISDMVKENVGDEGRRYFPLIFTLFMFVLFCNMMGMIPYSFTVTSHIIVTFALASLVFIGVTLLAFIRHGFHFFSFFLPAGTPWWIAPLLVVIEFFAYLSRPISLSVRLAANMMAGHTMLKVIAGFVALMGIAGIAPVLVLIGLTGFEIFVAVLQAYIFTILTCVYLNDAIHLH